MAAFYLATIPLVYGCYRIVNRRTAWMRTTAVCLGLPILFAIERGNLIVPCFTFFVLGHGRLVRSARWRWLWLAISINFKPYLILTIFGQLLRRRWRWFEGCCIVGLLVYLITYTLEGEGDPITVLTNISLFATSDPRGVFERATYASSYVPLMDMLPSNFPLMHFIGSRPIEILERLLPLMINGGTVGILCCFAGTLLRPSAVPMYRLAALGLSWVLTAQDPGGYAELFLLFLVFMEPWRGPGRIAALVFAYALSISFDVIVVKFAREVISSYLTNRVAGYDLGATIGMMARPAMLLFLEYALIATSLVDIYRDWRGRAVAPIQMAAAGPQRELGILQ